MEARKKKFEYQLEEEKLSHETALENKLEEEENWKGNRMTERPN